jgi:drug/metabolite transporter (DMT)-like permease
MIVYVKLVLTAIFWGGTFIAARVVSQEVEPFTAALLRFVVASVFLVVMTRYFEGRLPVLKKHQIIPAVLLGLTGVVGYNFFFFSGLKTVEAGRAAIIVATNPVFIALLAACLFREKLTILRCVGIVLSVSGAIVVISRGNPLDILRGAVGGGEFYIFGCVVMWVAYSLIGKLIMRDMSPMSAVTYSCILGTVCLILPALSEGIVTNLGRCTPSGWLGVFYLGFFGSALGFLWYYQGIHRIGASRAAVFINFVPISAIVIAFFVLKEPVDMSLLVGTILVVCGAYLTNQK